MKLQKAFTLIELLVVIAIIALLSAIIFPVFARAKDQANRSGDISDMNTLRSALELYKVDQGAYPPALLGYVSIYTSGPNAGNVIPAIELKQFLYPKRVVSLDSFTPSWARFGWSDTTNTVYPNQDPRAIGTAPILDVTGDGTIDAADDVNGARQMFGPADGNVCVGGGVAPCGPIGDAEFYKLSGYEAAEVKTSTGTRWEARYTLFWTEFGMGAGSPLDDPRQLGYSEPPETTVITWNSGYREYGAGAVPSSSKRDIVLFLGGAARPFDSNLVSNRSWRLLP